MSKKFTSSYANEIKVNGIPPGPNSLALLERLQDCIGKPNYAGLYGISIKEGNGPYIVDLDGNVYLDCLAGASANILGYRIGGIAEAYRDAALSMQHTCFPYSPNTHAIDLAEKLCSIVPGEHPKRVMFGLSGSDSNDGAIKAVRKFTGRMSIIHFKDAWHGSTGLSQPASDFGDKNVGIYPESSLFLELPYPSEPGILHWTLGRIEQLLRTGQVGGLIAETIQGDSGILLPCKGFFPAVSELLKQYGALLIIDEVQSGMGRTGTWWAIDHEGVVPDLLVSAKGLSAGYAPISAVVGRADAINALGSAQQVFTYSGHPPSAAAALAVINYIESYELINRNTEIGNIVLAGLNKIKEQYPDIVLDVRGKGLMIGAQINTLYNRIAGKVFATRCMEKGLYVGFFGVKGDVIRIEPPFIITVDDAKKILDVFEDVSHEMHNKNIPEHTFENVQKYSVGIGCD